MISQYRTSFESDQVVGARCSTLWGLSASQLHDAYWRTYGVQCIRRGQRAELQPAADLFLLIEPGQLVLFDLPAFADHLAWRAALVTRLRVVADDNKPYTERVEVDERGVVRKISRQYHSSNGKAYRVLLTRRTRIARAWMSCVNRREGWRRIRRIAGPAGVDNQRRHGACFSAGLPREEHRLVAHLVGVWPRPDHAIAGISELRAGVWGLPGASLGEDTITVKPVWLGRAACDTGQGYLVGPVYLPDVDGGGSTSLEDVTVRDIRDIEPEASSAPARLPHAPRSSYLVSKRIFDVLVSGIMLTILSPVIGLVALCTLIDDGTPVLYGHLRQSLNGRPFRCWKFRTMCTDADRRRAELADQNVCDGAQFFVRDDPRITRVGRWLRRVHLDELPQLWNVLLGQMSLVGPRPSPDEENQLCPAWRELRLSVRPGITGLWQVNRTREPGRDFQEWVRYDVEYVERASFWLDIKILTLTCHQLLSKVMHNVSHQTR